MRAERGRARSPSEAAQYPYLLGTRLTLDEGAAPHSTLWVLVGVAIAAGVLILPSLIVLFRLAGRGRLGTPSDQAGATPG